MKRVPHTNDGAATQGATCRLPRVCGHTLILLSLDPMVVLTGRDLCLEWACTNTVAASLSKPVSHPWKPSEATKNTLMAQASHEQRPPPYRGVKERPNRNNGLSKTT